MRKSQARIEHRSDNVTYSVWKQDDLDTNRKVLLKKVIGGSGEVYTDNLMARIERTNLFVVAIFGEELVGVCAAKHPYLTYRRKMLEPFGLKVKSYPYELGWLWVKPSLRFKMIGYRLVKKTIQAMGKLNFFITIRNENHNFRLTEKLGFKLRGTVSGEHMIRVYTYDFAEKK